jgi:sulfur transfer protein SufE
MAANVSATWLQSTPRELGRLGLNDHLSAQRSNGLRAMVARIQGLAAAAKDG